MRIDLLLVGFGHVGRRFAHLLEESRDALAELGIEPRVVGIVTRRHGAAFESAGLDATRAARIVTDGGAIGSAPTPSALELIARWRPDAAAARLLVETTPLDVRSGEPAVSHIRAAFAAGIDVVTANKGPIACAWRELADDYDKIMILLAASADSGDPFTRGEGLEGDLRNLRISLPEERYRYGNMRSIADTIGLNRETARRKIHELVEAGLLMRTADGVRFDPASRQVDQTVDLLRRQLDLLFRFINEMIRDGIASVK